MQTTSEIRSEAEASSLRVFSANGFGDAVIDSIGQTSSNNLHHSDRATRSRRFTEIVAAAFHAAVASGRRLAADLRRQRQARATYLALRTLDARMLRDLGIHRSELMSVAAEIASNVDSTRVRLSRVI